MLDNHASVKTGNVNINHTWMTCQLSSLLSLLRPMLPSVGGFAISSDGYFYIETPAASELGLHCLKRIFSLERDSPRLYCVPYTLKSLTILEE